MTAGVDTLTAHLQTWLGAWPPTSPLTVTTAPGRTEPAWDGKVISVLGVSTPEGAVLSVPPDRVDAVAALADDLAGLRTAPLGEAVGRPGDRLYDGVFRWCTEPAHLADAGQWLPADDRRVPQWLRPFGGEVLVALDEAGSYLAGVGVKRHDRFGHELSVGTDERARGRGLARRLVSQAARRLVAEGLVVTYLHAPGNHASAKVAEAAGFPDLGWRAHGLAGEG